MYTTRLAQTIVERYRVENIVLSSHLVAYTAFNIIRKRFPDLDLYGVLRLPKEDKTISKELLYKNMELLRTKLKEMKSLGQLQLSKMVDSASIEEMVKDGIANFGAFHVKKPLKLNKHGDFESQDLNLLYYYHNRMIGYNLSHMINPHILQFFCNFIHEFGTKL
jgi:glycerol-3-phosphate O-acyltransferase